VDARADLLTTLDATPRAHHAFRVHFAGRKRRGDAVAQEDQRIGRVFVHATRAEQVHRVVGVQVEQTGQQRLVGRELHDAGGGEVAARERGAHFQEDALANDEAAVRHERVAHAVKQLPARDDDVARLNRRDVLPLPPQGREDETERNQHTHSHDHPGASSPAG
jgi:hypothetical protein